MSTTMEQLLAERGELARTLATLTHRYQPMHPGRPDLRICKQCTLNEGNAVHRTPGVVLQEVSRRLAQRVNGL